MIGNDVLILKPLHLKPYSVKGTVVGGLQNGDMFPSLTEMDHGRLSAEINIAKVKEALDTIAPLKASGIDGLHANFFRVSGIWWDLLYIILLKTPLIVNQLT